MPDPGWPSRAAGMGRRMDLAESAPYKPARRVDERPATNSVTSPVTNSGYKPGDELSRLFGTSGLSLADLLRLPNW